MDGTVSSGYVRFMITTLPDYLPTCALKLEINLLILRIKF
jgi:hypothetical protein